MHSLYNNIVLMNFFSFFFAVIYLEILDQKAYDNSIMFTLCSPISLIFLIYSYAIMMNGKAADLFKERNEDFSAYQEVRFGPIDEDVDMKDMKIRKDSLADLKLTKQ